MIKFERKGREIVLDPAVSPASPLILLIEGEGEGAETARILTELGAKDHTLMSVQVPEWFRDLSPWPAELVFRGEPPMTGGADDFLSEILREILPAGLAELSDPPAWIGLAGYSLAGLFALYAAYRTGRFSRIASVSGSLWFPGFLDYARAHAFRRRPDAVYLSLGDREARTRNPVMRTVEENTAALAGWYRGLGLNTAFQLNPGNHFREPAFRTAKGIRWLLDPVESGEPGGLDRAGGEAAPGD